MKRKDNYFFRQASNACRHYGKSIINNVTWRQLMLVGMAAFFMTSCSKSDDKETYDPNRSVELTSFHPDSGRIRETVLLDGENFGRDPSAIKVFFNSSEAKVIGSTGKRIMVLTPRMPGDTCILSVQIGNQKKEYTHKFRYKIEASVTTIAGNGEDALVIDQGLDRSKLKPVYIGADKEYNIFVSETRNNLLRINVLTNSISIIVRSEDGFINRQQPYANPQTNVLQMGAEGAGNRDRFMFCDPREGWAPKTKLIKTWNVNGCYLPEGGGSGNLNNEAHFQCLLCEADGMYYTRYVGGQIARINPVTWEATIIGMTPIGLTYGAAFHPVRKTELWFGYDRADSPTGAEPANSLYVWDVTDETRDPVTNMLAGFRKVSGSVPPMGAHRDGPLNQSQFNSIRMISFDAEGNLYVGDCRNHCIRMVNTNTNMVSTIIGIPGVSSPFKDGAREDATFNTLHGIVTDPDGVIYVADYHNNRVRRIAIE